MKTQNRTIIDVRTAEEHAGQHVPGSVNIPLDQLPGRMNDVKNMPTPIIAYCRTGNRSGVAVTMMKQHGIVDAMNGGGIDDMMKALK